MKKFIAPDLDILRFDVEDIIATSTTELDLPYIDEGIGWK